MRIEGSLNLLPVAVELCDFEGRLRFFNAAAAELFGREPPLGRPTERFTGACRLLDAQGQYLAPETSPAARVLQTRKPSRGLELVVERPDQSRVAVVADSSPWLDVEGELLGTVTVYTELGTCKVQEQKWKKAQEEAEKAGRATEEVLHQLSHELRTPLTAILGFSELLLNADPAAPERTEALRSIRRSAEKLGQLIDGLGQRLSPSTRAVPKPAPAPSKSAEKNLQGLSLLLVEDSLDNQYLVSRMLRMAGAEVEIASDGLEGIQKALHGNFDVILMDIQLPVLDGNETVAQLRSRGYHRPIVALSAYGLEQERKSSLQAGCDDYLVKPVERDTLVACVRLHVERARQKQSH